MSPQNNIPIPASTSKQARAWAAFLPLFLAAALASTIFGWGGSEPNASAHGRSPSRGGNVAASKGGTAVIAVGDIACKPGSVTTDALCRGQQVAKMIAKQDPRLVLLLGDQQYDRGGPEEYAQSFGVTYAGLKSALRPTPGNHDYATAQAAGYYDFFGQSAGPSRRGYYSFNIGKWHIVSLNSNCREVGCEEGSEQHKWLRRDLAKSSAKCTLAYWHHPLVSSGKYGKNGSVAPLWAALRAARAEVVLSGHEHSYERFLPLDEKMAVNHKTGMRQFVVGTGGRSLYPKASRQVGSVRRISSFGALKLTLKNGRYAWQFIDQAGKTLDSGATRCR